MKTRGDKRRITDQMLIDSITPAEFRALNDFHLHANYTGSLADGAALRSLEEKGLLKGLYGWSAPDQRPAYRPTARGARVAAKVWAQSDALRVKLYPDS